jgi:hypothetical protein
MVAVESVDEPPDEEARGFLTDRGWSQGTIFRVAAAKLWGTAVQDPIATDGCNYVPHDMPADGRFVVVSQTCDIAAPISDEPFVEALACEVEPDPGIRATFDKSFRKFEVDPVEGLMALATRRIPFEKGYLLAVHPEPWPSNPARRRRFAKWLSRRASRAAIPQPIVDSFSGPLQNVIRNLRRKNVDHWEAFNTEVAEVLLGLPDSDIPPFDVHITFLLKEESLSAPADDAIAMITDQLRGRLEPNRASIGSISLTSKRKMSLATYERSTLMELDYLTNLGEEAIDLVPIQNQRNEAPA